MKPWRIIVTRPRAQASAWCDALTREGFVIAEAPLIDIVPQTDPAKKRAIQTQILDFDHYHVAIFVSLNAVHEAMRWLDMYWPALPIGIRYYTVGATTARAIQSYGLAVEDLAVVSHGAMNSETLLDVASLQQVEHERVIIFRGEGGRTLMADTLRARGAHVDFCELYQRQMPLCVKDDFDALVGDAEHWNSHYNVIALHSGESITNLQHLLALWRDNSFITQQIKQAALLVPSMRLMELAQSLGFSDVLVADNATDVAMTKALCNAR